MDAAHYKVVTCCKSEPMDWWWYRGCEQYRAGSCRIAIVTNFAGPPAMREI
jgi:hypothetical protein